ncbi:MAG: alpha-amylase family glycosyl hydrolase [Brevinematia bacterium]
MKVSRTLLFLGFFSVILAITACSNRVATNNTITTTTVSTNTTNSGGSIVVDNTPINLSPSTSVEFSSYTSISLANKSNYPVSLSPYEIKVIVVSNLGRFDAIDTSSDWYLDAIFYQVFIRGFYDSDGNGIGDLEGFKQKLSYITNVGFNAVWFLPIFSSPSYHGYDTTDYYSIDSDYGDITKFNNLLSSSHALGIKVVLDMVINHTSTSHYWFSQSANNNITYKDWYVWTNTIPSGWQRPWGGGTSSDVWIYSSTRGQYYYAAFWSGMPDLNLLNPSVSNEIMKIGSNWLAKGVDGFRMDAVRYLIETGPYPNQADTLPTKVFLKAYNDYLRSLNPKFYTVGEVWENNGIVSGYYNTLENCFNFDFAYSVANSLINENPSYLLNMINTKSSSVPWRFFAPFLDNHDDVFFNGNRISDELGGNWDKQKLAAGLLLTFPGVPFVYYGTEIGMMKGSQGGDLGKRTPMHWNNTTKAGFTVGTPWTSLANNSDPYNVAYQLNDANSLLNFYRKLISLRKIYPSLRRGDFRLLITSDSQVISYIRIGTNESVIVVANFSGQSKNVTIDITSSGLNISSSYNTYLAQLYPSYSSSSIQIDGIKESVWNLCKVAGAITNTNTETVGWDFGGFLALYITNDSTNLYLAFEVPNNAGGFGNTINLLIDSPKLSYNKTEITNISTVGSNFAKNVIFTNGFSWDYFIRFYADPNSFVGSASAILGDGTPSLSFSYATNSAYKFIEVSIPFSALGNITNGDVVKVLSFYSGVDYPATAYGAIPFDNINNTTTGGTTGPLPPGGIWNSLTILDDYVSYTVY